jgi:biotin synthase
MLSALAGLHHAVTESVCCGITAQVCTTLGMLTPEQAKQLREAGLTAYNHNLDTSPEYYGKITTTRK